MTEGNIARRDIMNNLSATSANPNKFDEDNMSDILIDINQGTSKLKLKDLNYNKDAKIYGLFNEKDKVYKEFIASPCNTCQLKKDLNTVVIFKKR